MSSATELFWQLPSELWGEVISYLSVSEFYRFMLIIGAAVRPETTPWHSSRWIFENLWIDQYSGRISQWKHMSEVNLNYPRVALRTVYVEKDQPHDIISQWVELLDPIYRIAHNTQTLPANARRISLTWDGTPLKLAIDDSSVVELRIKDLKLTGDDYLRLFNDACARFHQATSLIIFISAVKIVIPPHIKRLWLGDYGNSQISVPNTIYDYAYCGHPERNRRSKILIYDALDPSRVYSCSTREEAMQIEMPNLRYYGPHEMKLTPFAPRCPKLAYYAVGSDAVKNNLSVVTVVQSLVVRDWEPSMPEHQFLRLVLDNLPAVEQIIKMIPDGQRNCATIVSVAQMTAADKQHIRDLLCFKYRLIRFV